VAPNHYASVLATALGDNHEDGARARSALAGETLWAPEIIDLEVTRQALDDLADIPLTRPSHQPWMGRICELRPDLSSYDAAYVALAEALEAALLTGDLRLARAHGPRCDIAVFS
jgi:hypothetical protein